LNADNYRLRRANKELSRRRRAPKIELKRNEAITTEETERLLAEKEVVAQNKGVQPSEGGNCDGEPSTQSYCSLCQQPGHNKRTYAKRLIDPALVTSI
jgi:hypothetical protein